MSAYRLYLASIGVNVSPCLIPSRIGRGIPLSGTVTSAHNSPFRAAVINSFPFLAGYSQQITNPPSPSATRTGHRSRSIDARCDSNARIRAAVSASITPAACHFEISLSIGSFTPIRQSCPVVNVPLMLTEGHRWNKPLR